MTGDAKQSPHAARQCGGLTGQALAELSWNQAWQALHELALSFPGAALPDSVVGSGPASLKRALQKALAAQTETALWPEAAQLWCSQTWPRIGLACQVTLLWGLRDWLAARVQGVLSGELQALFVPWCAALCEHWTEQEAKRHERQARLVMVGQLFASIAHELRNPLAVLESSVFLLRSEHKAHQKSLQHLQKMTRSLSRCHEIIRGVLDMVRQTPPRIQGIAATELWSDLKEQFPCDPRLEWSIEVPAGLVVYCEPRLLLQCLATLVQNSIAAMHGEGKLSCKTQVEQQEQGKVACFEVCDSGPGFPPDVIGRGIELLVSRKAEGTGLGLALAESIAQRHRGRITLGNLPGQGAKVRIEIPQSSATA